MPHLADTSDYRQALLHIRNLVTRSDVVKKGEHRDAAIAFLSRVDRLSSSPVTLEEHRLRHVELHSAVDELIADFLTHNNGSLLSNTTLLDLIRWSHAQTLEPTEKGTRVINGETK